MQTRRLIPLGFALAVLATASPVSADCDPAGPVERVLPKADIVFVGTVTAANGPTALIAVREVWAGHVGETVELRGLGPDPGTFVEDDREWTVGQEYLFLPIVNEGRLLDHICTATTEWRAELAGLRPADARIVAAEEPAGVSVPPAVMAAGGVLLLVTVVSVLSFRRGLGPR